MAEGEHGSLGDLPADRPFPGVVRRSFSSRQATFAEYRFEPRASFPLHAHAQEQITVVERGEIEMTIGGRSVTMRAGDWSITPPDVEHGVVAGREGARFVAIVAPSRSRADEQGLGR
jgi:quercetin dioxygenase-like cupin family protein